MVNGGQNLPSDGPVILMAAGAVTRAKGALCNVPGSAIQQQSHHQFVYHQPITPTPPSVPHTLAHRHHSGLPSRRSTNARRSLSRALSSRPQLQRSMRHRDSQHVLKNLVQESIGATSRPQSVSDSSSTISESSSKSQKTVQRELTTKYINRKDRQSSPTSHISCSTVVITCPGDNLQKRRDTLWEYHSQNRGTSSASIRLPSAATSTTAANSGKSPTRSKISPKSRAWKSTESLSEKKTISSLHSSDCGHFLSVGGVGAEKLSPRLSSSVSAVNQTLAENMPYRLRPLGEDAEGDGGGYSSGMRSNTDTFMAGAEAEGWTPPDQGNRPADQVLLPQILPQFSSVYGQDRRIRQYTRSFSTASHRSYLENIGSILTYTPTSEANTGVSRVPSFKTQSDAPSIATSSLGPSEFSRWDQSTHGGDDVFDQFTDCSEDRRSPDSPNSYISNKEEEVGEENPPDLKDDVPQEQTENSQVADTSEGRTADSGVPHEPLTNADSGVPHEPLENADTGVPQEPLENADTGVPNEPLKNADTGVSLEPMLPDLDLDNDGENTPQKEDNYETSINAKDESNKDSHLAVTEDKHEFDSESSSNCDQNNNAICGRQSENFNNATKLGQVSSAKPKMMPTTPTPLLDVRIRRYKKQSYNLQDLTAKFRSEMSKQCRSVLDTEEKAWFDDIVRTSRVVDDTSYDSYARNKPLPGIKQTKKVYTEPQLTSNVAPPISASVKGSAHRQLPQHVRHLRP